MSDRHSAAVSVPVKREQAVFIAEKKPEIISLLYLPIVFAYSELLLRIFAETPTFEGFFYPLVFGASAGLFFAAVLSLLPAKGTRVCTALLSLLTAAAYTTECLVKNAFQVYMTPGSILSATGNVLTHYGGTLEAAILGGILQILLFFAPTIVYIAFGKKLRLKPRYRAGIILSVIALACSAALFGAGVLLVNSGDSKDAYRAEYEFDRAAEKFGLAAGLRLELQYSVSGVPEDSGFVFETEPVQTTGTSGSEQMPVIAAEEDTDEEKPAVSGVSGANVMEIDFDRILTEHPDDTVGELTKYVMSLTPSCKNQYTGLFEGKNLILVCAEAFSDAVIDEQLTPTLYRMQHNGIYFSEYYQPTWGGSTSTGEFSFVMGLAPRSGLESMQIAAADNNYFTLGSQLRRLGYNNCAFHNGASSYYNREHTHPTLGYDRFLAYGNGLEDIVTIYSGDSAMFDKTIDLYLDKQPFSLYYMTISGHFSYKADDPKVKENLPRVQAVYGSKYKDTTNYYLCYQLDLEKAMTILIQKLEDAGIADDTVICLTADHYPYGLSNNKTYGNTDDYLSDLYGYKYNETPWGKDRNAWLLWSGCLENDLKDYACEVSAPTYSLDIVPTLSNLFGLEYDSRLLVGRDVFSEAEPIVFWNSYNWVTERGKYNYSKKIFTPNEGYEYDEEYINRINTIVRNKIQFSYKVVDEDYYGVLFGKIPGATRGVYNVKVTETAPPVTTVTESTTKVTESTTKAAQSTTKAAQSTTKAAESTTKAAQSTTKAGQSTTKAAVTTVPDTASVTTVPETAVPETSE